MTAELGKAESHRSGIIRFVSRPGCQPCDRSEAGFQLAAVDRKISGLKESLSILESCV